MKPDDADESAPGSRGDIALRLRLAFLATVEADWRRRIGRPSTADELRLVLQAYPGDRGGWPRRGGSAEGHRRS